MKAMLIIVVLMFMVATVYGANPQARPFIVDVDRTDDQLVYVGTAKRILSYKQPYCAFLESLAAADDNIPIAMFNFPVTIISIGIHCAGTCTATAEISLEDRAGNAMTHAVPTASTGTGNTTYVSVTAANQLVAGEGLRFDVDNAVSPETDTYSICFEYTVDAQ